MNCVLFYFIHNVAKGFTTLLVLLGADAAVSVGDADSQLLRPLDDITALLGGNSVGDLGGVNAVLHHQDLQLLDVVHQELLEAGRQHMTGAGVGSVTDVGHQVLALEAPSHSVVNSLRLAPVLLQHGTRISGTAVARTSSIHSP